MKTFVNFSWAHSELGAFRFKNDTRKSWAMYIREQTRGQRSRKFNFAPQTFEQQRESKSIYIKVVCFQFIFAKAENSLQNFRCGMQTFRLIRFPFRIIVLSIGRVACWWQNFVLSSVVQHQKSVFRKAFISFPLRMNGYTTSFSADWTFHKTISRIWSIKSSNKHHHRNDFSSFYSQAEHARSFSEQLKFTTFWIQSFDEA